MVPVRRNPEGSNQVITPSQRSEKVTSLSKQNRFEVAYFRRAHVAKVTKSLEKLRAGQNEGSDS